MSISANRARWMRLSALFDQALDLDNAARSALIHATCAEDPGLGAQLERMLAADAAESGLDDSALECLRSGNAHHMDADDELQHPPGGRVGAWTLEHVIGRGGMGTVFAASRDDAGIHQRVAIKFLHRRWDGSLQAQRFLQERRILAALSHPNIPSLLDHGLDDDGRPWFALEYVDGTPLTNWADARRLSLPARIELFRQACMAVQHAHERFVVHRDLKPANILVDQDGHAHVLDFGVAKRIDDAEHNTRAGYDACFTPEYAAPEQVSGGTISAATDVHALGVVLYQLLTGCLPYVFDSDNLRATAEAISNRQAPRPELAIATGDREETERRLGERATDLRGFRRFIRGDLSRILQTALAKEPERRYPSVEAFSADLQRFLQGRPVSVSGDTLTYRTGKFITRNRWGVAMGAVAAVVLLLGLPAIVLQTRQAQMEAERANLEAARAEVQARRAIAARDFLFDILGHGSPDTSGNRHADITVSESLELARARLDLTLHQDPELGAELSWLIASAHNALGQHDRSRALLEPALASVNDTVDPEARARLHALYAHTLLGNSELDAAESHARHAIALLAAAGPHEALARAHQVLSTALYLSGHREEALAEQRHSTGLYARLYGDHSQQASASRIELSYFLSNAGLHTEAIATASAADAVFSRLHPDASHPDLVHALWAHGNALTVAGRPRDALLPLRRALPLVEALHGSDSTKYARSLQLLGRSEIEAGALEPGLRHSRQAVETYRRHAPNHPLLGHLDAAIGDGLLASGNPHAAIALLATGAGHFSAQGDPAIADRLSVLHARALVEAGQPDAADSVLADLIPRLQASDSPHLPQALLTDAQRLRHAGMFAQAHERLNAIAVDAVPVRLRAAIALERALLADATNDGSDVDRHVRQALALLVDSQAEQRPEYALAQTLAR